MATTELPITRKCLVTECKGRCGHEEIFCKRHWFSLPGDMRDSIWAAYANGDRDLQLKLIKKACKHLKEM
jgi:hypothetical protein